MAQDTNSRIKDPLPIVTTNINHLIESPPDSATTLFEMSSHSSAEASVLDCSKALSGNQVSPQIRDVATLLATMKSTVFALGKTFELVGQQTEKIATLAPAIKASHDIKDIHKRLEEQIRLHESQIAKLRVDLERHVKEQIRQAFRERALSAMDDVVQMKVSEKVGRLLVQRIPEELRDSVRGHRQQILEVQTNIHNTEARRMNSCLKSSADTLYPLLRPIHTADLSGPSSLESAESDTAVEPPTPSEKFPANLGNLWFLPEADLKALLQEYGVDSIQPSDISGGTVADELKVSREEQINSFLAYIAIAAVMAFVGRRQRLLVLLLPTLIFALWTLYYISQNTYQVRNLVSYITRPLWDHADGPNTTIPHYWAEGLKEDAHTCSLHGWNERGKGRTIKVLDAVLMSSELDLLEIRLNELSSVVDRFFIVESNTTFTGLPKEKYYEKNKDRFAKFAHKISYRSLDGLSNPDPWKNEAATRDTMTSFIRSHITEFPPNTDSLVIMSDVDEIPSSHTIRLLKHCDFGQSIHLQMRNYIYSFEWMLGLDSWRASVHLWNMGTYYRHSKSTENQLADAGWHCSFCFNTIREYIVKMTGYSHHDRIGGRAELLDPKRIQQTICEGKNIFGMLPEAYTYVLDNSDRFKFLLPGGCMRESGDETEAEAEAEAEVQKT
ncbi:hypothetical protein V5O48_000702 [Marasmius crinis-equi]|uniref:Glycosyltransferase family 17 protein n=1 Tax=Marasmius crinis-equi TaxID=585013 RepID=A0ABR3G0K2_9AGAR